MSGPGIDNATHVDRSDFDWAGYDGVLFDLDGVITPTAEIHERAWAALFAGYDYTAADYLAYIDGKPRYDGVRAFLASRDVVLPDGDPGDAPGDDTVCALGNRKNALFNDILEREGIAPYPGSHRTLDLLDSRSASRPRSCRRRRTPDRCSRPRGSRHGSTSSSTASWSPTAACPASRRPMPTSSAPSSSASNPHRSVVVEDAVSGVAAGAAGAFAVVIGVDRGAGPDALLRPRRDVRRRRPRRTAGYPRRRT